MNESQVATAAIEQYVDSLEIALRGSPRDKARLLGEIRDGLVDSATVKVEQGMPPDEASRVALTTFGSVQQLVLACQPELCVRQVRRTARSVVVTIPALIGGWHLYAGAVSDPSWQPARSTSLAAINLAGVSALAAVLSLLVLLTSGRLSRFLPSPRHLASGVAAVATISAVSISAGLLTLATSSPATTSSVAVLGAAAAVTVIASLAWSVRSCLRCATA